MVQGWLTANIDFILFLHGIVMLLLAGVLFLPWGKDKISHPEFNLQMFALGMCISQWIAVALYLFPGMKILFIPGMIIFPVSFLALLFYSMPSLPQRIRKVFLVYVPLALVLALYSSVKAGPSWGYFSLSRALAFPASLAAAYSFLSHSLKPSGDKRSGWMISAVSMFVYSVTWIIPAPFELCASSSAGCVNAFFCPCFVAVIQAVSAGGILSGIYIIKNEQIGGRGHLQEKYFFLLLLISAITVSWFSASWRGEVAGGLIKNEAMRHARAVANAINPERVTRLKFSPEDCGNPVFILMRNQMISYGHYSGIRCIYSFTMINGRLVFGPENIAIKDPVASPPGTVYLEPHPAFKKVFSDAVSGVIGPYKDEYGTFVSGYAPVIDPRTGKVLMVVGIDVSAESWRMAVSSARFTVFIITFILICAIMFMGITLVVRREVWRDSTSFAVRQLETFYIFGAGVFLSLLIFFVFNDYEKRKAGSDFIPLSDSVAGVIRENIVNLNYDLENLAKFFQSSEKIDRNEFKIFTDKMRFSPVKARAWYPEVKRRGAESFFLLYFESSFNYGKEEGYDLRSSDSGKSAVDNSLGTEMASFVDYADAGDGSSGGKLMTVILPVYKKTGNADGFVSLTADITLMLSYSMSFSKSRNLQLDAEIIDITTMNQEERLALYSDSRGKSGSSGYFMCAVYPVFIFDRVLGIKVFSSESYVSTHLSSTGAMGGLSALMLTFAVTILSGYLRRREYSLEDLVKERTRELGESEERFRVLHEASFGGIAIHDGGIIRECNEGLARLTGYTVDELIGMDGMLLVEPGWRDFAIEKIKSGFEDAYDAVGLRKDGSVYPLEIKGKNIPYHGKDVRVTEFRDITERKRNEELLRLKSEELEATNEELQAEMEEFEAMNGELIDMNQQLLESEEALTFSEKKYRLLFETSVDAIFLLDKEVFVDCNTRAEKMFNCTRDEIIGNSPSKFSPEFQPDGTLSLEKTNEKLSAAYNGEPQFFEWIHRTIDGTLIDSEISLSCFDADGRKYLIGIVRDVSERKKIEQRLSHMQKMDAIGQLAGGVAHDFNNQLSGILGYAEILSMKLGDSGLKKYSDGIISVAMRSADLTKKLLAFARKGQFQLVHVDMHFLIDETVEILKHSIDRRISIVKKYNSASAVVSGDPAQLQNALLNLGLNARDAMEEGGTLSFETEEIYLEKSMQKVQIMDVCEGDYIAISITDTGSGISDTAKLHLFEPFFTTKESGKGTGMGLASVYGTVKNHNGTISVYSEPGIGTTFRIYLPLISESGENIHRGIAEQLPDVPPQSILIIDDEDVVRGVLSEMLRDMGHSLIEASNGIDGVSTYRERWREIDLVIIDMIMPEMNGRDAFLEMKKINPDIRAILSSGFSMDIESQQMLTEGVMGFIHKPYRRRDLVKKIKEIIN